MTDLVRRQSARLSEDWLLFGQCWMIFRALRRTVTAGCLRQISCAIQFLFLILNSCLRSLLHSGACEGCHLQFEGCTKIPLKEPVLRLLKSRTFSRRVCTALHSQRDQLGRRGGLGLTPGFLITTLRPSASLLSAFSNIGASSGLISPLATIVATRCAISSSDR